MKIQEQVLKKIGGYITNKIPHGGVICITGQGTAGKTWLAKKLASHLGTETVGVYAFDNVFYPLHIRRKTSDAAGDKLTGCHPFSTPEKIARQVISNIKNKEPAAVYSDDLKRTVFHQTGWYHPKKYTIIDGLAALHHGVYEMMDVIIFMVCSDDVEFQRRSHRDIHERKLSQEDLEKMRVPRRKQYEQYILPYKKLAHIIVDTTNGENIQLIRV
ncbi:MAG: hypothetical protein QGH47_05350 [Candidatus Woesearchaeota archaeon]|jgi:uridine kinase|nr:hypothetical protein [Candidatus Woesearchaeota archaeon]